MTRHAATPGELQSWGELLAPLSLDRAGAVKPMLSEVVGDCGCGEPIRRCDRRRLFEGRLFHLHCAPVSLRPRGRAASHPSTTTEGEP